MSGQLSDKVLCTWIEVRGTSRVDPGEITLIYYIVDGASVVLTDANGQRRDDDDGRALSTRVGAGDDCAAVARRLARRPKRDGRERPLLYEKVLII
jgi:hypothetical protein